MLIGSSLWAHESFALRRDYLLQNLPPYTPRSRKTLRRPLFAIFDKWIVVTLNINSIKKGKALLVALVGKVWFYYCTIVEEV